MKTRESMKKLMVSVVMNGVKSALRQANASDNTVNQATEHIQTLVSNIIDDSIFTPDTTTQTPSPTATNTSSNDQIDTALQDVIAKRIKAILKDNMTSDDKELNEIAVNTVYMALSIRKKSAEIIRIIRDKLKEKNISEKIINDTLDTMRKLLGEQPAPAKTVDPDSNDVSTDADNNKENAKAKENEATEASLKDLIISFIKALLSERLNASEDTIGIIVNGINAAFSQDTPAEKRRSFAESLSSDQKQSIKNSLIVLAVTVIGFILDLLSPLFSNINMADIGKSAAKMAGKAAASAAGSYVHDKMINPLKNAASGIASFFSSLFSRSTTKTEQDQTATVLVGGSTRSMSEALSGAQAADVAANMSATAAPMPSAPVSNPGVFSRFTTSVSSFASSLFYDAPKATATPAPAPAADARPTI